MYDFQPLGETSIRLLQVQPALRDGRISCILNQYDDHIPPYDALSYYWGDPKSTRKIYVNDSLVDIHEALWEFLDQSQRCPETGGWIWTDFLCLNQRDSTEMGHQVPRMGHIYSTAERTLSWLGCNDSSWILRHDGSSSPSTDLEQDMRLISKTVAAHPADFKGLSAHAKHFHWTRLKSLVNRTEDASSLDLSAFERHGMNILKDDAQPSFVAAREVIINIFSLPYWTRVWITQEVALAKQVLVMFGGTSLDFEDLVLAYDFYGHWMDVYQALGDWYRPIPLPVPMEARAAVHENIISFQTIMLWAQLCKASRVEDCIYGLLGILQRCGNGTDRLPSILAEPIDYTRDWSEVYWEIVLTYNPLTSSSIIDDPIHGSVMPRWMRFLPGLGEYLSCPFTRKSLQYADNKRATPLCRYKARVALCVVDICRQTAMTNISIWLPDTITPAACTTSWPTKLYARKLWSGPFRKANDKQNYDLQFLLGTLLIENAEIQDLEEDDKYHAALIGLEMMKSEPWEGGWKCIPHQSMKRSQEYEIDLSCKCRIWMPQQSSELPCSSLSNTSSTSSSQASHKCQTTDRHLLIARTGWRLSLTDLRSSRLSEAVTGAGVLYQCWTVILHVKC